MTHEAHYHRFSDRLLAAAALLLATVVGLPAGVVSGSRRRGLIPSTLRLVSVAGLSLPPLLTSLVLALLAARTGWFPIGGMYSLDAARMSGLGRLLDLAWHLVLPTVALALPLAATIERLQAQAMAEALSAPFIMSAIGRGISRRRVIWWHAFRAAIKPVASVYGIIVGSLLSGSFAVEIVTAWPGLGRLMYEALLGRDIYLVAGCAAVGTVFLAIGSLMSDVALAAADPRLREAS